MPQDTQPCGTVYLSRLLPAGAKITLPDCSYAAENNTRAPRNGSGTATVQIKVAPFAFGRRRDAMSLPSHKRWIVKRLAGSTVPIITQSLDRYSVPFRSSVTMVTDINVGRPWSDTRRDSICAYTGEYHHAALHFDFYEWLQRLPDSQTLDMELLHFRLRKWCRAALVDHQPVLVQNATSCIKSSMPTLIEIADWIVSDSSMPFTSRYTINVIRIGLRIFAWSRLSFTTS